MRRLHVVGQQERFVASGLYVWSKGAALTQLVELWSIHEVAGAQFVRVDRDGRAFDGCSVLYESLINPEGRVERVDWRAYGGAAGDHHQVKTSITFYDEHAEIIRIVNGQAQDEVIITLPEAYSVDVGPMILKGRALGQTASNPGGSLPVLIVVPQCREDTAPEIVPMQSKFAGPETFTLAGRTMDARRYEVRLREETAQAWVDDFDTLLRYESEDLVCVLTQYAHRPASV